MNSRATTKGKAQRFDAMMEQLDIRKAQVSQRILVLKTEEESLSGDRAKAEHTYQSVSSSIQSTNEECVRLDEEIQKLQEKLKELNRQMETGQAAYHREVSRLESLKISQKDMKDTETVSAALWNRKKRAGYQGSCGGHYPGKERLRACH